MASVRQWGVRGEERAKVCVAQQGRGLSPGFIGVQSWAGKGKALQSSHTPGLRLVEEEGAEVGWLFTFSFCSHSHQDETQSTVRNP